MRCETPIKIGRKWLEKAKQGLALRMQGIPLKDEYIKAIKNVDKYPNGLYVPCGKCHSCKEKKKREYVFRYLHATKDYKYKYFITLTYDNDNLPKNYSLCKKDATKYLKRVREKIRRNSFEKPDYVYFLVGEYGDKTGRPHYHIVIATNREYEADIFKKQWNKGIVDFQKAYDKLKSVFYTIGYVEKKQGTKDPLGREAPFRKFSRGLGKKYAIANFERLKQEGILYQGFQNGVPKYYRDIWEKEGLTGEDYKDELHKQYIERRNKEIKELYNEYSQEFDTDYNFEMDGKNPIPNITTTHTGELVWKHEKEYRKLQSQRVKEENKHRVRNRKKREKI